MCDSAVKLYRPRNPEASPFFRLVRDHFEEFERVYDERFQPKYGYWRPVIRSAIDKFLKCGDLREGFARVRQIVAKTALPGVKAMARQLPVKGVHGTWQESDIVVEIRGQDTETLSELAGRTVRTMQESLGLTNVYVLMDLSRPEYQVRLDRTKAAELGVSVADVASALRTLITGSVPTRYREAAEYYDIRVLVPESRLTSRQDIENLSLTCAQSTSLRVRDIATFQPAVCPVKIIRRDQVKQVTVEADMTDGDLAGAVAGLRGAFANLDLPAGYEFDFGGQADLMADMKDTVLAVLAFALFFSFMILTVQFNSVKLPALILGSVPISLAGVVYLLYVTGFPLGATIIIGVLVVVDATVNDGVLLLTFADKLQEREGVKPFDAVMDAVKIRLRPRVMTTLTTMMGLVPLAMNLGEGGDMLQPMAVGGLGMEITVALFLMPCMYVIVSKK